MKEQQEGPAKAANVADDPANFLLGISPKK